MKRSRWILVVLAGILIAGVAFGMWQTGQAGQESTSQVAADGQAYQTTTVRTGSITVSITGSGKVVASQTADLGFSTSGQVTELFVTTGDTVTEGQVLARMGDTRALELNVRQQQVAVLAAEQTLRELAANAGSRTAQALIDRAEAEAAYQQAQANLVKTGQGRCQQSVTETYFYEWADLEAQIRPWQTELDKENSGYGRDYILQKLEPLLKKSAIALANYNFCLTFTDAEVEASQAALQLTKAQYEKAMQDYARLKASDGIETSSLEIAQAGLKNARLQLAKAEKELAGATLTASINGTVTAVNGQVGDTAGTGAFISLADLENPQVKVTMDETDLPNFALGCPAVITFDSLPGQSFSGTVTQIQPALGTDQLMTGMDAFAAAAIATDDSASSLQGLVDLNETKTLSGKALMIGQTAAVEVTCSEAQDVLVVAAQALYYSSDASPYVYVLNQLGQPEKREVEIGLKTVALVEIKSGLVANEQVILSTVEP